MNERITFKGLVYVKYGAIGTRSEGPDYYLQTRKDDLLLMYTQRHHSKTDYFLEFYCRKMVEITGEPVDIGGKSCIQVESVVVICENLIPE